MDTHTHTHTHTRTHISMIHTGSILRNQVRAGLRLARAWFKKQSLNLHQNPQTWYQQAPLEILN